MSNTSASEQTKSQTLERLRFMKRQAKGNAASSSSSSMTTTAGQRQGHYPAPPTQSRDGTVNSRYFTPAAPGPNMGKVLVPNSSPEPPDLTRNGPNGVQHSSAMPTIPGQSTPYAPPWAQGLRFGSADPLAASTSFTSSLASVPSSTTPSGSAKRPWNGSDSNNNSHYGHQPPPSKKLRGPSMESQQDVIEIPSSPEVQRAGTRHVASKMSLDSSISEDDVLPDIAAARAGPSKSRLVRDRPTPPAPSLTSTPSTDAGYQFFKLTHPMDSDERCKAAWGITGGDKVKADALVSNPAWSPPKPRPVSTGVAVVKKEAVGRVEEVDEINKQQRAAVKEKGKKSMIYANRPVLDTTTATPQVSKAASAAVATPQSPETPFIPARAPKRRNKLVESSDEEEEEKEEAPREVKKSRSEMTFEGRALQYFNTRDSAAVQELTGCTAEQAAIIISKRPFDSQDDFTEKVCTKKKSAGGISAKVFDDVVKIFRGYGSVDSILEDCEQIGANLRSAIAAWTIPDNKASSSALPEDEVEDGALALHTLDKISDKKPKNFLTKQPAMLPDGVKLKDYQLLGVNWLNLLYSRKYSCILADEMGLGKTIQVISFLAHPKERGNIGPHLIVVPSSTLENWCREFARFAPDIKVQTYYGGKNDRPLLRATLLESSCDVKTGGWEVLITTYQLAVNDSLDRKFFKKVEWNCAVFDEGHVLKNFQSSRYQYLVTYNAKWKLLLTGTPLQNNLQELVSLMNFILPDQFHGQFSDLQEIFKAKGDANVSLLSQERISRAKKMMTPFVLRRKKAQVLKDLPNKSERIEWCELTDLQRSIYNDALERSRKTIMDAELGSEPATGTSTPVTSKPPPAASKKKVRPKDKQYVENSSNVLMDLRKAASHPMLFRTLYTDGDLNGMTKQLLKEPDFKKRGAVFEYVKEDMTVMTDAELQLFCSTYKCLRRFSKDDEAYLNAGKVKTLLSLIAQYREEDRKILIFSQFTQILDILQVVLRNHKIKFLLLTGSTPVDVRQTLVDEFTEDESIPIFLLSTKAGGMGINLTAASVVIMFDQDFNPHNDKQAQDRAYRIGQKRDVDVVKLISRGTIEEDMLKLGVTKLALDEAVAGDIDGDGEAKGESKAEKEVKTSLMRVLRRKLEDKEEGKGKEAEKPEAVEEHDDGGKPRKKDASSTSTKDNTKKEPEAKRSGRLKTERSRV